MNKKLPAWIVLTVIALVAALALGATYNGTKDRIAAQEAEKAVAVRQELLPSAADFDVLTSEEGEKVFRGLDAAGEAVGYVSTGTVTGFGGPVEVTVGTDAEGTITGVRVGGANFSETAGLGAKSKEPKFYEQFTGKAYPVELTKNGGEIDAITAATITSSAVVRGVNDTIKTMSAVAGFKVNEPVVLVTELGNNRYSTSKKGFGGPVYVELEIVDGAIADIVIGDDSFNESAGYGQKAKEQSFYGQYIGKGGTELALGSDIDAISGATITSKAVNDAVNMILLYVNDPAAFAAQMADAGEEIDVSIPEGAATYTAQAKGLTGTFDVTIGVDENGAVNGIALGDASTDMDAAFLGQVKDNSEFLAQFIGATGSVNAADIDMVTGATISSQGTVEAVNKAYNKYLGIEEAVPTAAPVQEPAAGTAYDTTAQGLIDPISLTVTVDNGAVTDVTVKDSNSATDASFVKMIQNDANYLAQFVGKSAVDVNAIDIVAGATVSSKSIAQAVSDVLAKAAAPAAEGTAYDTTAQGLVDKIDLTVTVDNGTITAVEVKDSNSATDAAFVKMIQTDANYLAQFVGKTEIDVNAIDLVSGATISSKSIAEAVIKVLASASAPAEEPAAPAGTSYDTTAQGLVDPINLTVTVDNGTITAVEVKDSNSATDAPFVKMIQTDANYLAQFVGKTSVDVASIDLVSGATISSKSIAEAVSKVLANASAPAEEPAAPAGTSYDTTAQGLVDPINLTVTVDNGTITAVEVKNSNSATDAPFVKMIQTDANYLAQFVGKTSVDVASIDLVSGATISSKSIAEAVSKVLANAAVPVEEPATPAGTAYDTTAQGLVDPINLTVTVDNGAITAVEVKDSNSATDASFVKMIQTDANYLAQFVGKTAVDVASIDLVSGATISSKSIAEAVGKVLANASAPIEEPAAPAGMAYDTTAQGLVDPINLTVTVDNGTITAVEVKDSNSATDASFVKMIQTDANYLAQFVGKTEIDVNAIDLVSGATISSKSIAEAVSKVLANAAVPVEEPATPAGTAYDTTAQGLVDPINLTVTVDNGAITAVEVKDSNSATDASFVKMIQTDANYLAQFVGKTAIDVNAIDLVSGATISSKSIAEAVSKVLANAAVPVEEPAAPAGTAYDTTAQGLVDPINLTVTVDNGAITAVEVKDSNSATDASFVKMIQTDANYLAQFVGKTAVDVASIDLVSGATISSKSIAEAVGKVLANASAPAEEPAAPAGTSYDTTAQGLVDPINLTVTVDNGTITAVEVKDSNSATDASFVKMIQTDANYLAQFVGKTEIDINAIDLVSGATISSKSIAEAVGKVLANAVASVEEPAAPAGTAYDTTAQGLVDPINLTVTVDNGTITAVEVKNSNSATDAPFVKMIQTDANYLAQFVGKTTIDISALDLVSGATISSKAIAQAVSDVLAQAVPVAAP